MLNSNINKKYLKFLLGSNASHLESHLAEVMYRNLAMINQKDLSAMLLEDITSIYGLDGPPTYAYDIEKTFFDTWTQPYGRLYNSVYN